MTPLRQADTSLRMAELHLVKQAEAEYSTAQRMGIGAGIGAGIGSIGSAGVMGLVGLNHPGKDEDGERSGRLEAALQNAAEYGLLGAGVGAGIGIHQGFKSRESVASPPAQSDVADAGLTTPEQSALLDGMTKVRTTTTPVDKIPTQ